MEKQGSSTRLRIARTKRQFIPRDHDKKRVYYLIDACNERTSLLRIGMFAHRLERSLDCFSATAFLLHINRKDLQTTRNVCTHFRNSLSQRFGFYCSRGRSGENLTLWLLEDTQRIATIQKEAQLMRFHWSIFMRSTQFRCPYIFVVTASFTSICRHI